MRLKFTNGIVRERDGEKDSGGESGSERETQFLLYALFSLTNCVEHKMDEINTVMLYTVVRVSREAHSEFASTI